MEVEKKKKGRPRGRPKPFSKILIGGMVRMPDGRLKDKYGRIFEEYINDKNKWDLKYCETV